MAMAAEPLQEMMMQPIRPALMVLLGAVVSCC
jgi:hypothetical protein